MTVFSPQNNSFLQKIYLNPQVNGEEDNGNLYHAILFRASLIAQLVKNLSAMWETWVPSFGWEDPLEKEKATHSSILAQRISWTI